MIIKIKQIKSQCFSGLFVALAYLRGVTTRKNDRSVLNWQYEAAERHEKGLFLFLNLKVAKHETHNRLLCSEIIRA